jgi:hypothetical protein
VIANEIEGTEGIKVYPLYLVLQELKEKSMTFAIARMAKQKGGSVGSSSLHNGRQRETPNADPSREKDNRIILGSDRPTPEMVREVIAEHGGKPRSDSVEAIEVLLTASPEWWRDDNDEIDHKKVDQFSAAAREFLLKRENGGICVKAILHMDERTPHIHAHTVPIDPKGKLNCKHYFGTRGKFSMWQDRWAEQVKELGLERGEQGSRARHTTVKEFYRAIERDPHIRVNYDRLPQPPRMCLSKDAAQVFKEEFAKALIEQIQEPIRTQLHQAMLARDTRNKLNETKKRLADARQEISKQQLLVAEERYKNELLREQKQNLQERADRAEERVQDVDHATVMKMMGYKGLAGANRGTIDFVKPDKNLLVTITPGGAFDRQGHLMARTAVSLVQQVMKTEGREVSKEEAVGWLADRCGHAHARAAALVDHEDSMTGYLKQRSLERDRSIASQTREDRLSRHEHQRTQDRGIERDGHDRDFGISR